MNDEHDDAHYELLGELAAGGMATVYLGRETTGDGRRSRLVAIKSMKQELAEDDAFTAMFMDEATLTLQIKHPNVVSTIDAISSDGRLLIIMEYVEGVSLARLLDASWTSKTSIAVPVAVATLYDVLRGLHAAHELVDARGRPLNVVHRDVSPQNVLVGTDGVARILDFGIAKAASQRHVTAHGEIKGKLAYMPPEQQLGETVDRRSDVYAAGVVLWEMLAGKRLFSAKNEEELVRKVFEAQIEPPSMLADEMVPAALDRAVLRAIARTRDDRFRNADEMASALAASMVPARPDEVARMVKMLGNAELEQRARRVDTLERTAHAIRLEPEAQLILEVLTGSGRRMRRTARGTASIPRPVPAPPTPNVPTGPARAYVPPPGAKVSDRTHQMHTAAMPGPPPPLRGPHASGVPVRSQPPAPMNRAAADPAREERRRTRRKERQKRTILILVGLGVAIIVLSLIALIVGMGYGRSS